MPDAPRWPLRDDAELRKRIQAELGLDSENLPLGLTDAEKLAAQRPGLPAEEKQMEAPKSGFVTSEFWLKLAAGLAIAVLGFTIDHGLPAIASQLPGLGVVGTLLLLTVPLAKAGLGWALAKLSSNYTDARTEVKLAAMGAAANTNTEAKAAA